jgi:hypothetical protein
VRYVHIDPENIDIEKIEDAARRESRTPQR